MSDLDTKLRELKLNHPNIEDLHFGYYTLGDQQLAQIKQAFADEMRKVKTSTIENESPHYLMTGQEWMSRFTAELKPLADGRTALKWREVRDAAWKASGVKDDTN